MADHPRSHPPGSLEAIDRGCLCAIYDNNWGEGCDIDPATGEPMFVIRADCPLHSDHITVPDPAHNPAEQRSDAAPGEPQTRAHNGEDRGGGYAHAA